MSFFFFFIPPLLVIMNSKGFRFAAGLERTGDLSKKDRKALVSKLFRNWQHQHYLESRKECEF
jgi:hypothetical protein